MLPLPPAARTDLAFIDYVYGTSSSSAFSYRAGGDYYDIPVAFSCSYVCTDDVANRVFTMDITDRQLRRVWSNFVPGAIVASDTGIFSAMQGVTSEFESDANIGTLGLPTYVLQNPYQIRAYCLGAALLDTMEEPILTLLRIPTGGPATTGPSTATPVLALT